MQKNLSPKIVFILLSMLFCLVESNVFSRCEFTHLTESVLKGEEGGEKGKKEGRKQNSFLMTRRIALSHLSLSVRCHPFLSLTVFICKTISNELSIKKVVDRHSFIMSCYTLVLQVRQSPGVYCFVRILQQGAGTQLVHTWT